MADPAMPSLPPIRLAVISTRERYNASGCASDLRWAWRTQTREELQFQDGQGVWHAVPRVPLPLDDSAETAAATAEATALQTTIAQRQGAAVARVEALRAQVAQGVLWVAPESSREYGQFLDAHAAESTFVRETDGYTYYRDQSGRGKPVSRFSAGWQEVSASALADWLDPVKRLQALHAALQSAAAKQ